MESSDQSISIEARRLQIMQERIASLVQGYENALTDLQLQREMLIHKFQEEKNAWEEEKRVLLEKIQGADKNVGT